MSDPHRLGYPKTMQAPSVVVVIPLYTTELSGDARMALARTVRVLRKHPLVLLCPAGLDLMPLQSLLPDADLSIERFETDFFKGVEGYNRLMLSAELYSRFLHYDYMLVCQTDAYVFSDQLSQWCMRGYDWIGAPWVGSPKTAWSRTLLWGRNMIRKKKKYDDYLFKVGNGGFSLRRVSMFLRIVHEQREDIASRLRHPTDRDLHIEDRYFSQVAPLLYPDMRIPDWEEAAGFCIDRRPRLGLAINGGKLPFACHGFDKRHVRDFWQPILQRCEQENLC